MISLVFRYILPFEGLCRGKREEDDFEAKGSSTRTVSAMGTGSF